MKARRIFEEIFEEEFLVNMPGSQLLHKSTEDIVFVRMVSIVLLYNTLYAYILYYCGSLLWYLQKTALHPKVSLLFITLRKIQ